jgi:hypothetical protein
MKSWRLVFLVMIVIFAVLAGVVAAPPISPPEKTAAESIWSGTSGGFKIRWTENDIQAHPAKFPRIIFSARSLAEKEFALFKTDEMRYGFKKGYCEFVGSYRILSLAGSIMSFFEETDVSCEEEAHPSRYLSFTAIDLKKPGSVSQKLVKLTDYFPKSAIYQALMAEPRVRQALARREPPLRRSPRNLAELYTAFKDVGMDTGEIIYVWPDDFLARFAFHHLLGNQVAIRLALPALGPSNLGDYLELQLLLPVPQSLKTPLALASTGKEGFLMQDQERLSKGKETTIRFTKGKKPPDW